MRRRKCIGIVITAAVAVALLFLSFRKIEWSAFVDALRQCDWGILLLSALAGALMPLCRSLRWRQTVLPFSCKVKRSDSIFSNYAGYLVNMAVPFTHEAVRCMLMHKRTGEETRYDRLVGVAFMERACDALCIVLLFLVTTLMSCDRYFPFIRNIFTSENGSPDFVPLAVLTVILLAGFFFVRKHRKQSNICGVVHNFLKGMKSGFESITKLRQPVIYVVETVFLWFIYWLQLYLGAMAMPSLGGISAADCLFLSFVIAISSLVPVPGGMGAFHFMVASALSSVCGVSWDNALAYSTLVHESQAVLLIVCGTVSAVILKSRL